MIDELNDPMKYTLHKSLLEALSEYILVVQKLYEDCRDAEDRHIYRDYLSNASVIIALIISNKAFDKEIELAEHYFGNTWLKDTISYNKQYSVWCTFTGLLRKSLQSMTVNERIFTLGLDREYDNAKMSKNTEQIKLLLRKCLLTESDIETILQKLK